MKKLIPIAIAIILLFGIIDYKYTRSRYKDVTYAVEHYITSGFFNRYKLKSIENLQVVYSDKILAIATVIGVQKSSPNRKVKYEILVKKNSDDGWEIEKIYNVP